MSGYENIKASLFGFCKSFVASAQAAGLTVGMAIYNFDAFQQNNTLPAGDLIGPYRLSVDVKSGLVTVTSMIGIATQNDENLFRLDALCGQLLDACIPNTKVPLLDSGTGAQVGLFTISEDVSLSPSLHAKERPLKLLHLVMRSDVAF